MTSTETDVDASDVSEAVQARTIDSDVLVQVGRVGWVAKGVVYFLIGVIAVPIAFQGGSSSGGSGSGGEQASRQGAIGEIAQNSFGGVLLWAIAIGLVLYALWRIVTALMPGDNSELDTWAHRVAYLFSGALYAFLAWSAISFATSSGGGGSGGSGGDGSTLERLSRWMLERPGGRWVLGLGALVALGVAGYFVYKGVKEKFMEQIDLADASEAERTAIHKLGTIGWVGRGITVTLLSIFVLEAAINANPDEARGLDQALRSTADSWWGSLLVLVAGAALIAYGIFAAVSARHRRLIGP